MRAVTIKKFEPYPTDRHKGKERRVYPQEFKAEAAALAQKYEKPVRQIAPDLGVNENMLYRWIHRTRQSTGTGLPPFPGHGTRN
jgi:transposase-like protein